MVLWLQSLFLLHAALAIIWMADTLGAAAHLPSSRSQHSEIAVGGGARHGSVGARAANPVEPAEGGDIYAALHTHGLPSSQEDQMEAALYGHMGGQKASRADRDQFVVAIPTADVYEGRVAATRASRLGLRSVIITNYTAGLASHGPARYPAAEDEVWTYYPDDKPIRSYSRGDSRVAMAAFVAYKALLARSQANFKWLFVGDDDTLFFVEAAREVTSRLDPETAIFLTDNAWFTNKKGAYHPNQDALRCVPCNYAKNMSLIAMNMTRGCPCTPEAMCKLPHGYSGIINAKACGPPRAPSIVYMMHGGGGAVLSIGLLRNISYDKMEQCILSQWGSTADSHLTVCLWQFGIAMTDPDPLYHPERMTMFDPVPAPYNPDEHILPKASHFLGNLLRQSASTCTGICKLELDHTISLHVRASKIVGDFKDQLHTERTAQAVLRALSRFYAVQRGLVKKQDSLSWLQDTRHVNESGTASVMDSRIAAVKTLIEEMPALFQLKQKGLSVNSANLTLDAAWAKMRTKHGLPGSGVSVIEKAQSGAATAIARQALAVILQDCEKMQ